MLIGDLALFDGKMSISDPFLVKVLFLLEVRDITHISLYLIGRLLIGANHKGLIFLHLSHLSA